MGTQKQVGTDIGSPDLYSATTHDLDSAGERFRVPGSTAIVPQAGEQSVEALNQPASARFVGRYRLDVLVGRGGFGEVWRGFDPELQRVVAVKLARPDKTSVEDSLQREARKAAALSHPGIVQVYDVASIDDQCVIVSEFIEGESLADRLRKGSVSVEFAVGIIVDIARAVQHAHSRGLVHRDIKPGNILLRSNGTAVLTDFGLSVTEDEFCRLPDGISGTVKYMSPEQARGEVAAIDHRSDIFSLGLVLYVMLAGRLPYPDADTKTYLKTICTRSPRPLRTIVEHLPRSLDQACMRCLATNPNDRYSTCLDFIEALRSLPADSASTSPSATAAASIHSPHRRNWFVASGAVFSIALLFSGVFVFQHRRWQPIKAANKTSEAVAVESFTSQLSTPAIASDIPLSRGDWFNLLKRPPALVVWPSGDGRQVPGFSAEQQRFAIRSDRTTWIYQCGELPCLEFRLRAMVEVDEWTGSAGFVWGLRDDPSAFPETQYACYAVRFFRGEPAEPPKLMVSELILHQNSFDEIRIVRKRTIAESRVQLPATEDAQFEIHVAADFLEVQFGPDVVWRPAVPSNAESWLPKGTTSLGIIGEGRDIVFRSLAVCPLE